MILKNQKSKRILSIIIIVLISALLLNFLATKIVYDTIFRRQEKEQNISSRYSELLTLREELSFYSKDNRLAGYYYEGEEHETLVVISPGYSAGADDYLPQIDGFLSLGYGVFAFDPTGSYNSEGNSAVGFPQTVIDLRGALDYLATKDNLGYESLVLFGHSRGGYASSLVSFYGYEADAIISVSGSNSAMEGVINTSASYVGKIAYLNYPFLWAYQALLFDTELLNLKASEVISQNEIPTLIIHSSTDTQIPPDSGSIIAYKNVISNRNAEFILWDDENFSGHSGLLRDKEGNPNEKLMERIADFIEKNRNEG